MLANGRIYFQTLTSQINEHMLCRLGTLWNWCVAGFLLMPGKVTTATLLEFQWCGLSFHPCSNMTLFWPSRWTFGARRKSLRLIGLIIRGPYRIVIQWQSEVDGMGMNDSSSICLCKKVDREIRLDVVFDVFLLAKNDRKCMPARKSLL